MSNHVRISGETATHLVNWQNSNSGRTFCGIDFRRTTIPYSEHTWPIAVTVANDCDCMTCLVKANRVINFTLVINYAAIAKLTFDEE